MASLIRVWCAGVVLLVVAGGLWGGDRPAGSSPSEAKAGPKAGDRSAVVCRVRPTTPGGVASHIRWIIANGSWVKQGQPVVALDDAAVQDRLRDQLAAVDEAGDAYLQAVGRAASLARDPNGGSMDQATAAVRASRAAYRREQQRAAAIQAELRRYYLVAPRDGVVAYEPPTRPRDPRTPVRVVAEGAPVWEGQVLLRIVDPLPIPPPRPLPPRNRRP